MVAGQAEELQRGAAVRGQVVVPSDDVGEVGDAAEVGTVVELADDDRAPQRGQAGDDLRQAGEAVEGLAAEAVAVGGDEHDGLGLAEAVDHAGRRRNPTTST